MKTNTIIIALFTILSVITSCTKPLSDMEGKVWAGNIYRMADEKELAIAKAYCKGDTLFIYANAIFGSERDTLILSEYRAKDSTYIFTTQTNQQFRLQMYCVEHNGKERFAIIGDDFFIAMGVYPEINTADVSVSYLNIPVSPLAMMYLDGAYEGQLEYENTAADIMFQGMGGVGFKLVFEENFKLRWYDKSIFIDLFGPSNAPKYATYQYHTDGEMLVVENYNGKDLPIAVKDGGRKLVIQLDAVNAILRKVY